MSVTRAEKKEGLRKYLNNKVYHEIVESLMECVTLNLVDKSDLPTIAELAVDKLTYQETDVLNAIEYDLEDDDDASDE